MEIIKQFNGERLFVPIIPSSDLDLCRGSSENSKGWFGTWKRAEPIDLVETA